MKSRNALFGIALALMVLLSAAAPAFAAGVEDGTSDALAVDVEQGDDVVVTVTNEVVVNNTTTTAAVENATVTVNAANNSTYAANQTFVTDANGSVALPEPTENVTVTVTATWNDSTATTAADLVATGAADGDEETGESDPYTFGQRLSAFIHEMLHAGDDDGPLGRMISEFARSNNPGADHRSEKAESNPGRNEETTTGSTVAPGSDHTKEEREHGKQKAEKRNDHAKEHGKQKHDRNDGTETTEQGDDGDDGGDDHAEETTAQREQATTAE